MLRVRREQLEALTREAADNFEGRLVEHLREWFPKKYDYLTREGSRAVVRRSLARAKGYGLTDQYTLGSYADLVFLLGSDFDHDPQFPWASEILNDPEGADETERMASLYARAYDYFERVAGPDGKFIDEALGRAGSAAGETFGESPGGAEFYARMLDLFKSIYPQKYGYVGELGLRQLVFRAVESARRYGLEGPRGVALYACLMFLLGSGFATDPQFPWAEAALAGDEGGVEARKVEGLYGAAMQYLASWSGAGAGPRRGQDV
jgi:hypothetical protein